MHLQRAKSSQGGFIVIQMNNNPEALALQQMKSTRDNLQLKHNDCLKLFSQTFRWSTEKHNVDSFF